MSDYLLEAQDVAMHFGGVKALDGVDLRLKKGELRCLLGPNGAGKSTFFKMLMGTERPTSGTIVYKGEDITRTQAFRRARIGISVKFQNMRVLGDLSVFQNLFIPLCRVHPRDAIPAQVATLLALVGLPGTEDRLVRHLSHGQQQWLAIAMSLAGKPELLLLDEPTAGLSGEETERTAEIIREVNRDGMTVVVIEHDMAFIRSLHAHTSVLHLGRLFADGTFDEVAANEDVKRIYLGTM